MVRIELANERHFAEVLAWLKIEKDQGGEGFYCNRNIIEKAFAAGEGLCVFAESGIIGFAIFQMFTEGSNLDIIEVQSIQRRQGVGSQLLIAAIDTLREQGAKYIHVECTSTDGEALCLRHGFEPYVDPDNYRSVYANPLLRLYLSEWRPTPKNPWV